MTQSHPQFKKWLFGFLLYGVLITGLNVFLTDFKLNQLFILQICYCIEFAIFTFLGIGLFTRWKQGSFYLPLWRIVILVIGGLFSILSLKLLGYKNIPQEAIFPIWAFSLIGLSIVSLMTRYVPAKFFEVWLAMEKNVTPLRPVDPAETPKDESK